MTGICTVCREPVAERESALCNGCNEPFHLALRQGAEGRECGRVWVNEQFMTLEYGCQRCLGELSGEASINGAAYTAKRPTGRRRYRKVR